MTIATQTSDFAYLLQLPALVLSIIAGCTDLADTPHFRLTCKTWRDGWPARQLSHTAVINAVGNWSTRAAKLKQICPSIKIQIRTSWPQLPGQDMAQVFENPLCDEASLLLRIDLDTMLQWTRSASNEAGETWSTLQEQIRSPNSRVKLRLAAYLPWCPAAEEAGDLLQGMNSFASAITDFHLTSTSAVFANVQTFRSLRHLQYSINLQTAGDNAVLIALHHLPSLTQLTLTDMTGQASRMSRFLGTLP